jgi:hypothetical protein
VEDIIAQTDQAVLAKIAILPSITLACFLCIGLFLRRRAAAGELRTEIDGIL